MTIGTRRRTTIRQKHKKHHSIPILILMIPIMSITIIDRWNEEYPLIMSDCSVVDLCSYYVHCRTLRVDKIFKNQINFLNKNCVITWFKDL